MKNFFKSIYALVFPNRLSPGPASVDKLNDSLKTAAQSVVTFNDAVIEATKLTGKSVKQFRKLRLQQMYKEQQLQHESAHKIAAEYKITLRELADYYHYFGQLPRPEYKIIIQNYGVDNLIADFENLIETT